MEKASWATLHLLDGHCEERPSLEDAIELALNKPLWRLLAASGATHCWHSIREARALLYCADGACRIMMMMCIYFQIFITMATVVSLSQISLARLNWPTPKHHTVQEPRRRRPTCPLQFTSRVMANFGFKLINFPYRANKDRLDSIRRFTDTVQLASTENPLFGAKIWGHTSRVLANSVLKSPNFLKISKCHSTVTV